jgi:hypothetical protein
MSACERCWERSYDPWRCDRTGRYQGNLSTHTCSAEEQAGRDAGKCPTCKRMTLHQHTGEPMCGCPKVESKAGAA